MVILGLRAAPARAICRRAVALQSTIHTLPLTTLPISQANWLARDCFSDISRPAARPLAPRTLRYCAQGPHANSPSTAWHVRAGDAGMKRHRPLAKATTVYLERRATGSLADLHLHLHAGPLPVARWPAHLYGRR